MFDYHVTFSSPGYFALLAILPVLWWFSVRRLALLGPVRRWIVIGLRTLVVLLIVVALAEIQTVRVSERLTVIYVVDQSLSIPVEQRRAMIEHVNGAIEKHRQADDRVGVVVFGRDAAIEIPPFDDDVQMSLVVESLLDPDFTNLAGAMKLAQASFPEDAAKRIVLISDGNENVGDVSEQALGLAAAGIGIDVVPIRYHNRSEVAVERLTVPGDVRRGQPFDMKVVVTNTTEPTGDAAEGKSGDISGKLVVSQVTGGQPIVISEEQVTVPPGKKVFTVRQEIDDPSFYTYEAKFVPDRPEDDTMQQNNRATGFTNVRGKGRVLLIENFEYSENRPTGEHTALVRALLRQGLEVEVHQSDQAFTGLDELQQFDTVLLANVPREHFTDRQMEMLVSNTQHMGAGLVMLGGPNSCGAGGWANTEVEKALPLDFQIKSAKVVPRGALVMLIHACEIPDGNHWQKVIAHEAIKVLGARDYCGVLYWGNMGTQWMWRGGLLTVGGNRNRMMALVDQMTPGDMPDFDPALDMAVKGFQKIPDAAVRHMIIISDGDPTPPTWSVIRKLKSMRVTISTAAVGSHGPAGSKLLADIAADTGGKYYAVRNANALPQIFQREARRVARPLIWDKRPVRPYVQFPHEMVSGVEELPPLNGFVMTTKKDNVLVDVSLASPEPAAGLNNTILASWTYGLGKAAVFTSDTGALWTSGWTGTPVYDKLFGQIVRWSMRPSGEAGNFTVATEVEDEQIRVVVTALNEKDEFYNFLSLSSIAVGPDMKPMPLELQQTAPGRYVGTLPAKGTGSHLLNINTTVPSAEDPTRRQPVSIRAGVNVPYSDEFRDRAANESLLGELAKIEPKGGKPGLVIEPVADAEPANTFRHGELAKATSSQDVWYFVVLLASGLFFFDVFFRRVQVSLAWVPPMAGRAWNFVLRREGKPVVVETMQRLRSRKAEVTGHIDQLRADARFEAPETPVDIGILDEQPGPATSLPTPTSGPEDATSQKTDEESYTERLLRAKKKVWNDKDHSDRRNEP